MVDKSKRVGVPGQTCSLVLPPSPGKPLRMTERALERQWFVIVQSGQMVSVIVHDSNSWLECFRLNLSGRMCGKVHLLDHLMWISLILDCTPNCPVNGLEQPDAGALLKLN